jgi:hypothetical protein
MCAQLLLHCSEGCLIHLISYISILFFPFAMNKKRGSCFKIFSTTRGERQRTKYNERRAICKGCKTASLLPHLHGGVPAAGDQHALHALPDHRHVLAAQVAFEAATF